MADYKSGLLGTKKTFADKLKGIFSSGKIDDEIYDDLVEALILSDIPYVVSEEIIGHVRIKAIEQKLSDTKELNSLIKEEIRDRLSENKWDGKIKKPAIILFIGVNGAGKTTTIAKLAKQFKAEGNSVLLAAADTFRAAACEQLSIWADRVGVPIVKSKEGQDPASVIYDAVDSAKSKNHNIILADTAGRLQSKTNLMNELGKIHRVCNKIKGDYSLYTVLVLDAGAGQNSILQAESFKEAAKIDGMIMTKLDGSSKGGIIVALVGKDNPPMWYVGLGEGLDDLDKFEPDKFADAIL